MRADGSRISRKLRSPLSPLFAFIFPQLGHGGTINTAEGQSRMAALRRVVHRAELRKAAKSDSRVLRFSLPAPGIDRRIVLRLNRHIFAS